MKNDKVACCAKACGSYCGARNCEAGPGGKRACCKSGIPIGVICSPSVSAPCTRYTKDYPVKDPCIPYGGMSHTNGVTCCAKACGSFCGSANCNAGPLPSSACCVTRIPADRICGTSVPAPCTRLIKQRHEDATDSGDACSLYGGMMHRNGVTCCAKACGSYCGSWNCNAGPLPSSDCCMKRIPADQICSTSQSAPCTQVRIGRMDNVWNDWRLRFPELASQKVMSSTDKLRVWRALGRNWWMEFVDGHSHKTGPHSFDHSAVSRQNGQDGQFYKHVFAEYHRWSRPWIWNKRWTANELARLNSRLRGRKCKWSSCLDGWSLENPNKGKPWLPDWWPSGVQKRYYHRSAKRRDLNRLLAAYYRKRDSGLRIYGNNYESRKALRNLATLFRSMASMHPFQDANSRTRMLLLQTELVQLGGHPVSMLNNGWAIYQTDSIDKVVEMILHGWCNWEVIARTGNSPFIGKSSDDNDFGKNSYKNGRCEQ